jgi:GntR family transcriptional regulator
VRTLRLDVASYLPVSLQLKEQLRQLIERGSLRPGAQLPSIRELAGFLRVNRNTVLRAIAELESDGYVRREHGRGVFVSSEPRQPSRSAALERLLEETLAKAAELGIGPADLGLAFLSRPSIEAADVRSPTVLVVECNRPALRLYESELRGELRVPVESALVEELPELAAAREFSSRYELVVTTFFHVEEVEQVCAPRGLPVVGLLPQASLDTLSRLIALPPKRTVGIVCEDQEGIENMLDSLHRAGMVRLRTVTARLDDPARLDALVDAADLIVTSKECASDVRRIAGEKEVIVEDGGLDRSGLELLRRMLDLNVREVRT